MKHKILLWEFYFLCSLHKMLPIISKIICGKVDKIYDQLVKFYQDNGIEV